MKTELVLHWGYMCVRVNGMLAYQEKDGNIRVWNESKGHFTIHHDLNEEYIKRVRECTQGKN